MRAQAGTVIEKKFIIFWLHHWHNKSVVCVMKFGPGEECTYTRINKGVLPVLCLKQVKNWKNDIGTSYTQTSGLRLCPKEGSQCKFAIPYQDDSERDDEHWNIQVETRNFTTRTVAASATEWSNLKLESFRNRNNQDQWKYHDLDGLKIDWYWSTRNSIDHKIVIDEFRQHSLSK